MDAAHLERQNLHSSRLLLSLNSQSTLVPALIHSESEGESEGGGGLQDVVGRACLVGCGWESQLAVNWSAKSCSKVLIASPMPRELPAPSPKKDVQQLPLAKGEGEGEDEDEDEGEEGRRHLGRYHRSRSPSGVAKLAQQSATLLVVHLRVRLRIRVELLELANLVEWVVRCLEKGLGGVQHATKTGKCLSTGKGALTIFLNSTKFRVSALMGTATRALLASKYSNAAGGGGGR